MENASPSPKKPQPQRRKRSPTLSAENRDIGQAIRVFREAQGLTQVEMAQRCGLTDVMISKMETGAQKIQATVLTRMARAFHVTLQVIVPMETLSPAMQEMFIKGEQLSLAGLRIVLGLMTTLLQEEAYTRQTRSAEPQEEPQKERGPESPRPDEREPSG